MVSAAPTLAAAEVAEQIFGFAAFGNVLTGLNGVAEGAENVDGGHVRSTPTSVEGGGAEIVAASAATGEDEGLFGGIGQRHWGC